MRLTGVQQVQSQRLKTKPCSITEAQNYTVFNRKGSQLKHTNISLATRAPGLSAELDLNGRVDWKASGHARLIRVDLLPPLYPHTSSLMAKRKKDATGEQKW
jgi:hypothetical protein